MKRDRLSRLLALLLVEMKALNLHSASSRYDRDGWAVRIRLARETSKSHQSMTGRRDPFERRGR